MSNTNENQQMRLTALHMAREILTEKLRFALQTGDTQVKPPTMEDIATEATKILTFVQK